MMPETIPAKIQFMRTEGKISEKGGEVGNESIMLVPIEKIDFSFVLFIRNIEGKPASAFVIKEREDIDIQFELIFEVRN